MIEPTPISVRVLKYDGEEHRRWPAVILRQEADLLVLDAKFDEEIRHDLLGTIAAGTTSIEYYWLDRWYNIFRFSEPSGSLRNYYCNVNVPPTFDGSVLTYIDLDIDILVNTDLSYTVLDLEEFEHHAERYGYSNEVREQAERGLDQLKTLIETRAFPFN